MRSPSPFLTWAVGLGLGGVVLVIVAVFAFRQSRRPREPLPVLAQVPAFALTNQAGQPITLDSMRDKVWLGCVIFTRCPGPCAQMTRRMKALQDALAQERDVRFVCITSDPENDQPDVLQRYAKHFGADPTRWHFLTGPKANINELVVHGLKLVLIEKDAADRTVPNGLFIHSELFVLVDRQGRLRQSFESLEPGALESMIAGA